MCITVRTASLALQAFLPQLHLDYKRFTIFLMILIKNFLNRYHNRKMVMISDHFRIGIYFSIIGF